MQKRAAVLSSCMRDLCTDHTALCPADAQPKICTVFVRPVVSPLHVDVMPLRGRPAEVASEHCSFTQIPVIRTLILTALTLLVLGMTPQP